MKDIVKKEVIKLLKLGDKVKNKDLLALMDKDYDKEDVKDIISTFKEKYSMIRRHARKFAESIMNRYGESTPYNVILEKARRHAEKFDMTDFEFNEFQRILEKEFAGISTQTEDLKPLTNVMMTLGDQQYSIKNLKLNSGDMKNLEEILTLYKDSRELHYYVMMQSITYEKDKIDISATPATYDRTIHDINTAIHPLIAAMFTRYNMEFENRFIHSNITKIIYNRYKHEPIESRSDYELFYDIVHDPNDIVCSNKSTMSDLLFRANLQNQLWNCVLHLRRGKVYNDSFNKFINAVDNCTMNKYNNPDFIYGTHDGTVLKRLLNAFSYKPTHVATYDTTQHIDITNPYLRNMVPKVTRIPLVSIVVHKTDKSANIEDHMKDIEYQFILSNGVVLKKKIEIIYSRGNIFVHLNRALMNIKLNDNNKYVGMRLPAGIEQFEKMTTRKLIFRDLENIEIGKGKGNQYMVTGIVCNETYKHEDNVDYVTNDLSYIRIDSGEDFYEYHPKSGRTNVYKNIKISKDYTVSGADDDSKTKELLENNATIYILSSKNMNENLEVKEI